MGAPGFDDASMVMPQRSSTATPVTFVYPYYRNPEFLGNQVRIWSKYAAPLRTYLSAVIVDDGSPYEPAVNTLSMLLAPFDLRLFRVEKDIRWNWLAARNIGMHHARGWCLLTDIDHVIPEETADAVVYGVHDPKIIYRFSRRESNGTKIHPHPNSMLMTRDMFWKVGGYDEALSGHYGTDGDWRRRCVATAPIRTLPYELVRHEFELDSSTTHYLRKQPQDAAKKAIISKRGKGWRPKSMSFAYHEEKL